MVQVSQPSWKRSPTTMALAAKAEAETSTGLQLTALEALLHSQKRCAWPLACAPGAAFTCAPRVSSTWQPKSTKWACRMGTEDAAYMNNHMGNRSCLCSRTDFGEMDSMCLTSRRPHSHRNGNFQCLHCYTHY